MARAENIIACAAAEAGYTENPPGSNRTKYGEWYGLNGQPWCMMFVQWVFRRCNAEDLLPVKTAGCGALMRAAQRAGIWVTGGYRPGDVVIFDFPGGAATDHCGIVTGVSSNYVYTIEGNTGAASAANGGRVERQSRPLSQVLGAVRPRYEEEEESEVVYKYLSEVPEKFRPTIESLMNAGIIQGDGSDPVGNGDVINLTHEQVRTLVFVYRGGGFDRQLLAKGLPPAVRM